MKIIIRGKGSVKEGKLGRGRDPLPGEDEPLHAYITGQSPEAVKGAVERVRNSWPRWILIGFTIIDWLIELEDNLSLDWLIDELCTYLCIDRLHCIDLTELFYISVFLPKDQTDSNGRHRSAGASERPAEATTAWAGTAERDVAWRGWTAVQQLRVHSASHLELPRQTEYHTHDRL